MRRTHRNVVALLAGFLVILWSGVAAAADLGDPALRWEPAPGVEGDFARPCVVGTLTGRGADGVHITLRWDEQRDPACPLGPDELPASVVMLWPDLGDPGTVVAFEMGPYNQGNAIVGWTEIHTDPAAITLPAPGRYFASFMGAWNGVGYLTVAGAADESGSASATPAWLWFALAVATVAAGAGGYLSWRRRRTLSR